MHSIRSVASCECPPTNLFSNVQLSCGTIAGLQDAISRNLLVSDQHILSARVLAINVTTGELQNCAWWRRQAMEMGGPRRLTENTPHIGQRPDAEYPWYVSRVRRIDIVPSGLFREYIRIVTNNLLYCDEFWCVFTGMRMRIVHQRSDHQNSCPVQRTSPTAAGGHIRTIPAPNASGWFRIAYPFRHKADMGTPDQLFSFAVQKNDEFIIFQNKGLFESGHWCFQLGGEPMRRVRE